MIKTRPCSGLLLAILVFCTNYTYINGQTQCQFGSGCVHDCNCAGNCDSMTGCMGNCTTGWDGPTCQRQNVALSRYASQSTTGTYGGKSYPAENAVNGRTGHSLEVTPCTHTGDNDATPTWSVTLDKVYKINAFRIYNRAGYTNRLSGFTLSVGSSSQNYLPCYIDLTTDPGLIIDGSCNQTGPVSGDTVSISLTGTGTEQRYLSLCEVLILVCSAGSYGQDCEKTCGFCAQGRQVCNPVSGECPQTGQSRCQPGYVGEKCQIVNVAYNRTSNQSSTYLSFPSINAVDGKTGHNLERTPCTHTDVSTATNPASWTVRLDKVYTINRFQIYNRNGSSCGTSCSSRLAGFTLSVGNSFQSYLPCYIDQTSDPGPIIDGFCNQTGPVSGDTVRISLDGIDKYLTLCEVLILECTNGTYGPDCEETCGFCAQGQTVCDITSGDCPDRGGLARCRAGYHGQKCKQECADRKWGADCLQSCGHCYNGAVCDKTSGVCPQGDPRCSAGYKGQMCDTECADRKWGADCLQSCGHCYNGAACNKTSGVCPQGNPRCSAGYKGEMCDTECADRKWGADCVQSCGHCYNGAVCNKTSGVCPQSNPRCSAGYKGEMCDIECADRKWGADCVQSCDHCYNGTACNKTSGVCPQGNPRCSAGYKEEMCETECDAGTWGADCVESCGNCKNGTVCNRTSGDCRDVTPRCSPGYHGSGCNTECVNGTWGADCVENCGYCSNGTACEKSSGECPPGDPRCSPGYNGTTCDTVCNAGKWGANCRDNCGQCYNGNACNSTYGECPLDTHRCSVGFKGMNCDTECNNGMYGADCLQSCGHCYNGAVCDKSSGECPLSNPRCQAGFVGPNCNKECKAGNWGQNCEQTCSENCFPDPTSCHKANGTCLQGCANSYTGDKCDVKSPYRQPPPEQPSSPTGAIAGGVIAAGVCGIAIAAAIVFWRRRHARSDKTNDFAGEGREEISSPPVPAREPEQNGGIEMRDVGIEVAENEDVNLYENAGVSASSVSIEELKSYVKRKKSNESFKKEFEKFPAGLHAKHDAANKEPNKFKNRYKNLVAYDDSRVVLRTLPDEDCSDYINACHINGYKEPKKYIAAQGPNDVIINDFLRMIWEQNVGKIVMLTNLVEGIKTKCDQYWPSEGCKRFGLIEVTLSDEEVFADYTTRTFQLAHAKVKNKVKTVQQFHFTTWPDHGVPSHAMGLLDFRHKVLNQETTLNGPILVHCSAGIGRTGTFIALDYLLNQARDEGRVDVIACVRELRKQRVNMIQAHAQYEFLHEALVEAIKLSDSYVWSDNFTNVYNELTITVPETGQTKMAEEFKLLQEVTPAIDENNVRSARHPDNKAKNRSNKILALDSSRPFLSTNVTGSNNYINAVFLPSLRLRKGFVLTQTPLPNTMVDFWRLVYEHNVSTIVMLDRVAENDKKVGIYWPEKTETFDSFVVETVEVDDKEDYCVSTYKLTYKDTEVPDHVQQFRCKFWPGKPSPKSLASLLFVMQNAESWQKENGNGPILVHCRDGVTKSGMYCAVSSIIERLKADREVNILLTLAEMRIGRPEIITNLEQYQCLYEIIKEYLENFQTYANFS